MNILHTSFLFLLGYVLRAFACWILRRKYSLHCVDNYSIDSEERHAFCKIKNYTCNTLNVLCAIERLKIVVYRIYVPM